MRDLEILICRFGNLQIQGFCDMVFRYHGIRDLGISRHMHLGIWEFVDLRVYGFECLWIWGFRDLDIWDATNLEIKWNTAFWVKNLGLWGRLEIWGFEIFRQSIHGFKA